jgi:hypothetical protein
VVSIASKKTVTPPTPKPSHAVFLRWGIVAIVSLVKSAGGLWCGMPPMPVNPSGCRTRSRILKLCNFLSLAC